MATPLFRTASEWLEIHVDVYLDARQRTWLSSEETGDVIFVSMRGVVLVHRERAQPIAAAFAAVAGRLITPPPTPRSTMRATAAAARTRGRGQPHATTARIGSRRSDVRGWLAIVAGAAVFVAALAVPLDDPALVAALALGVRGGRTILAVDS
jgi:hypothetical protein